MKNTELENMNTLTGEQIEEIVNVLHNDDKKETGFENLITEVFENENKLAKSVANVEVDPVTGMALINTDSNNNERKDISISDIIEEKDKIKLSNISEKNCKELTDMGLTIEETQQLYNAILRYNNNEKFNIYNELPKSIQVMVENVAITKNPKVLNKVAKDILNFFINQLHIEQEFIDLQNALQKELNIPGMVDMYADHLIQSMEGDLIKKADYVENTDPEKAKQMRLISSTFTDTYKFTLHHLELDNNPKIIKKINKDLKKFNRHCNEFNFKYQNSKFKINSIFLLVPCLERHLNDDISSDDIKKFILLFTNICRNMSENNIVEHTFMYYTIKNILILEHLQIDNGFYIQVKNNILNVINKMKQIEKEIL